nr:hypothetical protein [Tanacetum cinerariifolium]
MDKKKHIVNLESFRDMLHICLRVHGQSFAEPPFEEKILAFIRFLGHSAAIGTLTDVNINKLYHPWRSFAAIINKCLIGKTSGYDSLRLSQAQILWGLYYKRYVDYAYLMWEDFVYQAEHKNYKKSNEMYYPRFTKVIIHHFMSKDLSIPKRNKLTNEEIRNSNAYKEYYAIATVAAPPKPKASVRRTKSSSDTFITPPTAAAGPRLTTSKKGKQVAKASKAKSLSALSEMKELVLYQGFLMYTLMSLRKNSPGILLMTKVMLMNERMVMVMKRMMVMMVKNEMVIMMMKTMMDDEEEGNGDEDLGLNIGGEEGHIKEEEEYKLYRDVNINQGRGLQMTLEVEDSHVTLTLVNPDGMESIFETTSQMDAQTSTSVAPLLMTAPTMTPFTIATITTTSQAPAVKVAVQIQSNRLRDKAQRENDEFLKTVDENMQKIIKEQVKEQVKVQVSKILPRIEQTVNEQFEAEVLTRSSHSSNTFYVVAADLSEMELKKILIKKMEGNKSIQRSDEQRNLYKAFVEAYESDNIILNTYQETITLKRRRDDDADNDEEPFAGPERWSKRHREGKEPESASAPSKTVTRSTGRSTQGSQSQ